jgi:hypothetical protein
MAKKKPTSRRSGLVGRAVTAGRRALKEAESRVPPDLRKQVERRVRDANKTVQAAIKEAQVQVKRARTRSDVNSFLKRLDGLTKQAKQLARGTASKRSTTPRATRKATTTRKPATRKAAAKRPAASASTSTRRTAPRRRAARKTVVTETPVSHPIEAPVEPPMG